MPETRIVETTYGKGGYDPTKPNNNIIEKVTAEVSDEQLAQEQADRDIAELLKLADGDIKVPQIGRYLKALAKLRR